MSTESIKVSSMEDRADKLRQRKAPLNTTRPSRDKDPTEEIIGQENIGTPPSSETIKINTSTLDHRSEIAQLWLQSRLEYAPEEDGPSYRRKGEYRPLTRENIRISVRLFRLLFKPFVQLFWEGNEWKIMGYVFGRLVKGIFPAGR